MPSALRDKLRIASDYVRFRLHARSRYTIHSPFLFELVNEVFRDTRHFYAFDDIESIRDALLADDTIICEESFGEASKALPAGERRLSDIVRTGSLPAEYGRLLFRMVCRLRPGSILELGTAAGISTLYLASAAASVPVITLEGSRELSAIAQRQLEKMKLSNVRVLTGSFSDTLPQALQWMPHPGFVFIDGDHRKEALLDYLQRLMPCITAETVIVIDDIHWSDALLQAWQEIVMLPQVTLSLDLFRMGMLFFRKGIKKQHLMVVY